MDVWKLIRDENCTDCELHSAAQSICLLGNGPAPCDWMLVGEAPGKREDDLKKVFQHKAGEKLDAHLKTVNRRRDELYISNAVKCRPPKNRTPTSKEIKACRQYLLEEIRLVHPKTIIAMGASAIKAVTGDMKASVKGYRNKEVEQDGIRIIGTYHPMAEGYDPYVGKLVDSDFERAFVGNANNSSGCNHLISRRYLLYHDEAHFQGALQGHIKGRVSFDFETTGLDFHRGDFTLLALAASAVEGIGHCLGLDHIESETPGWKPVLTWITDNFSLIGHNIKYELKCLLSQGYSLPLPHPIHDTMILFHLLDENYPGKRLIDLKRMYTDLGKREDLIKPYIANLKEQPLKTVASYNCEDTDGTLRVFNILHPEAEKQGLIPLYDELMRATQMLAEMEYNGCRIDLDKLDDNTELFNEKRIEIGNRYPGYNLNADLQVADLMYNQWKLPVIGFTEKNNQPATSAEVIRDLLDTREGKKFAKGLKEILAYKKLVHFDSHFLTGIAKRLNGEYFYPSYNLAKYEGDKGKDVGTVTGRLSASLIHQIPRDTEELEELLGDGTAQIREMFISRFRGGCITRADWSQAELRLLAQYSDDEIMISDFNAGMDFHEAVTKRLLPKAKKFYSRWPEFAAQRKATKAVNFGVIYGISPHSLSDRLDISLREAKEIIDWWFLTYKMAKRFITRLENEAIRTGEVRSLVGRKRRLAGADRGTASGRRALRQAVNSPIQGLSSDINLICMRRIWDEMKRRKMQSLMLISLHDEMVIDTHPKEKEVVADLIKQYATNPDFSDFGIEWKIPFFTDIAQRKTWSKRGD